MELFIKGQIIIIEFPFSDLSDSKKRPALIIQPLGGDDVILCQITSKNYSDPYAILINQNDLSSGYLRHDSFVRIGRLFTADRHKICGKIGHLNSNKFKQIISGLIDLINT